jgi:hypothetical protein
MDMDTESHPAPDADAPFGGTFATVALADTDYLLTVLMQQPRGPRTGSSSSWRTLASCSPPTLISTRARPCRGF